MQIDIICSRFYYSVTLALNVVSQPSLADLKSRKYLKKSGSGYSHSRLWEDSKQTKVVTLRLDERFFVYLDGQKGPKNATRTEWLAKHPTIRLFNVVDQQANIPIKSEGN